MARHHLSLLCSPNAIARVLRAFPKLALVFLVVHVGLMIYAILNSSAPVKKSHKDGLPHEVGEMVKKSIFSQTNSSIEFKKHNRTFAANKTKLTDGKLSDTLLKQKYKIVR